MINEEIRDKEVRLLDSDGAQLGVVSNEVAQKMAEEKELDLVLIVPQGNPPVCKIMDYGKFRFDKSKRDKEQKKHQKVAELKEIRLSPNIDTRDLEVKGKACAKFLKNGDKVRVSIRFRGRQAAHGQIGMDVMNSFLELLKDDAVLDRPAKQEGRIMFMILSQKTN
ncbi:MAG: translation initiation factor IF-3 [Clostridia bacterium]